MKPYAVYLRVSAGKQSTGLEAQERAIKSFLASKGNGNPVGANPLKVVLFQTATSIHWRNSIQIQSTDPKFRLLSD